VRRAVPAVKSDSPANLVGVVGSDPRPAAMHVQVDEAGQDVSAAGSTAASTSPTGGVTEAHIRQARTLHPHADPSSTSGYGSPVVAT
jgi:hypothetical protein